MVLAKQKSGFAIRLSDISMFGWHSQHHILLSYFYFTFCYDYLFYPIPLCARSHVEGLIKQKVLNWTDWPIDFVNRICTACCLAWVKLIYINVCLLTKKIYSWEHKKKTNTAFVVWKTDHFPEPFVKLFLSRSLSLFLSLAWSLSLCYSLLLFSYLFFHADCYENTVNHHIYS
jgi:hypothetical protein